jgi:dTDP-4-dehydrorhamnose 3,5-epimerase
MKVTETPLAGVLLIAPSTFEDERGLFRETYERQRYMALGINSEFVQDNHSRSLKNVLRGMHFTRRKPQAQLLTVIRGVVYDVVVDLRRGSSTFGSWSGTILDAEALCQIYMPEGFAHGFCVLSDYADLHYKVTQFYDPDNEVGLRWDDPEVGIKWPVYSPLISSRDLKHPLLHELDWLSTPKHDSL